MREYVAPLLFGNFYPQSQSMLTIADLMIDISNLCNFQIPEFSGLAEYPCFQAILKAS